MIIRIIDKNRNMRVRNKCLPGLAKMASPLKVDLTKKEGFGPIEIHEDDQSKRAARARYEMGVHEVDPTKPPVITDMEDSKQREKLYNITEKPRK